MSELRLATVIEAVQGKFTQWKVGEVVRARYVRGAGYVIERLKSKRPHLPLFNQCCGVPRRALKFHSPNV